jgi:DNA-binding protein H-NS
MAKQDLASMSVDALLKLRDDVTAALNRKADALQKELSRLGTGQGYGKAGARKGRTTAGRKVAPKYRSRKDAKLTWSGRGALPRWMREEMKGTKLKKENFLIKA